MLGGVNYPFQKCQHGCPHILEIVPEIFSGLPLSFFRLLVHVRDSHYGEFEEGSHINRILTQDGVEETKVMYIHHVSRVSIVGINGMVHLAQLVVHFLCQLVEATKLRPALNFLNRIEEGLDGLHGILHHDGTILGTFVRVFVGLYWPELEGDSEAAGVTGTVIDWLRNGAWKLLIIIHKY